MESVWGEMRDSLMEGAGGHRRVYWRMGGVAVGRRPGLPCPPLGDMERRE